MQVIKRLWPPHWQCNLKCQRSDEVLPQTNLISVNKNQIKQGCAILQQVTDCYKRWLPSLQTAGQHHHHHHCHHIVITTTIVTITTASITVLKTASHHPLFIFLSHQHRHFCRPCYLFQYLLHSSEIKNIHVITLTLITLFNNIYTRHDPNLENHADKTDQWPPCDHFDNPDHLDHPDHLDNLDHLDHLDHLNQPPAQVAASVADRLTATQCSVHTTQPWSALFKDQHVK